MLHEVASVPSLTSVGPPPPECTSNSPLIIQEAGTPHRVFASDLGSGSPDAADFAGGTSDGTRHSMFVVYRWGRLWAAPECAGSQPEL